jgi:hypothetical protein
VALHELQEPGYVAVGFVALDTNAQQGYIAAGFGNKGKLKWNIVPPVN